MARRRSRSSADEAADALGDLLMLTPWWAGPLLALGFYVVVRFVAPLLFSAASEPAQAVLGGLCPILAPLVAVLVLVIWVVAEIKKSSRRRLLDSRSDVESLRSLSWQEFEQLVGEAYRRQGYAVTESGGGGPDGGVDLVLTRDGEKTLVQCKQWRTWTVGVKIVRELYGVMAAEGAAEGIVVTCGRFTSEARAFGKDKPLELVDGSALWKLVVAVKTSAAARPVQAAQVCERASTTASPDANPDAGAKQPDCPKCGAPMVLRTARKGRAAGSQFYGCSRYPQCRGIRTLEARAS